MEAPAYLSGQLLLALPGISDPRFEKAVIAVCAHDDSGALGIGIGRLVPRITFHALLQQLEIEPGVAPDSFMATYAAVRLWVDSWRWEGVPFYVRAGKCLRTTATEVTVELRRVPRIFKEPQPADGNRVRLRLSPEIVIAIGARAKRPGEGMTGEPIELALVDRPEPAAAGRMDAYERLLGDAIAGDATLFARQDVVEAAWAIVDPVIHGPSAMHDYEPGSWGPREADRLTEAVGGWHDPEPKPGA